MQAILSEVKLKAMQGDPDDVLRVIDEYCWKNDRHASNVGDVKGVILDQIFSECNPTTVVELGAFVGYSAVRIGRLLKKPGAKLYSIEVNPESLEISTEMVEFAGLSDKVTFILGPSTEVISTLEEKFGIKKIDFLFLDHVKSLYRTDLEKVLQLELLQKGSVVVGDNILFPGAPEYVAFVRSHPKFESTFFKSNLEYRTDVEDGLEKSVYLG